MGIEEKIAEIDDGLIITTADATTPKSNLSQTSNSEIEEKMAEIMAELEENDISAGTEMRRSNDLSEEPFTVVLPDDVSTESEIESRVHLNPDQLLVHQEYKAKMSKDLQVFKEDEQVNLSNFDNDCEKKNKE